MLKAMQYKGVIKMTKNNYIRLAKYLETKYRINIKRFCYHLVKVDNSKFLIDYVQEGYTFPPVRKEIDKANKVFRCDINNMLQELCNKIKQDEYEAFTETLASVYQKEKIMFPNYLT